MNDELRFPIFNEPVSPPKALGMDDYLKFVQMNMEWFGYSEKQRQRIIQELVEVPFRL